MASSSHFPGQSKDAVGEDKRTVPHPEARRTLPNLPGSVSHGIFCSAGHAACGVRRWQQRSSAFWESLNAESGEVSEHVKTVSVWNIGNRLWFPLFAWNPQAAQAPQIRFEAEENSLWTLLLTSPGTAKFTSNTYFDIFYILSQTFFKCSLKYMSGKKGTHAHTHTGKLS